MNHPSIAALQAASTAARDYLESLSDRRVSPSTDAVAKLYEMSTQLQEEGVDPSQVVDELHRFASPATMASAGGRFFGLVVGGALPASVGARVLGAAWDQIVFSADISPAAAFLERTAAQWTLELLDLPRSSHVSFVTGATMGNFTCLAAAREHLLQACGHSVRDAGLWDAPKIRVIASDQVHVTLLKALNLLGWGSNCIERVPTDSQGRLLANKLPKLDSRSIVVLQAGNVNSGAFDPFLDVCFQARAQGSWVHVDGAFGLWAAASPQLRHLTAGVHMANSWTVDAHKWLNTPYDCGMAIVSEPLALFQAMSTQASYLPGSDLAPKDMGPEFSRSARAVEVWAALRSLGKRGAASLFDRCCAHARTLAHGLEAQGFTVLNDVVLNQVVATLGPEYDHADLARRVQDSGECWFGTTTWRGAQAIRLAVSNWSTTAEDIQRTLAAISASK